MNSIRSFPKSHEASTWHTAKSALGALHITQKNECEKLLVRQMFDPSQLET